MDLNYNPGRWPRAREEIQTRRAVWWMIATVPGCQFQDGKMIREADDLFGFSPTPQKKKDTANKRKKK